MSQCALRDIVIVNLEVVAQSRFKLSIGQAFFTLIKKSVPLLSD
jgi:hypothetical protein